MVASTGREVTVSGWTVVSLCHYMYSGVHVTFLSVTVQKEDFLIYKEYGRGNEAAQKLLYELEDDQTFQAFFLVSPH